MLDEKFPDRNKLKYSYQKKLIESIKNSNSDYSNSSEKDFAPRTEITQKQNIYFWIRLFLKEEIEIEPNDIINLVYTPLNEVLETTFICYSKPYLNKDNLDNLINYDSADDKKVLCLMVNQERINENSEDVPFIRSLFKISKYYEDRVIRKEELKFILDKSKIDLQYSSIGF